MVNVGKYIPVWWMVWVMICHFILSMLFLQRWLGVCSNFVFIFYDQLTEAPISWSKLQCWGEISWLLKDRFMSYILPGCYYDFLKLKGFGFNVFFVLSTLSLHGRFTHPMKNSHPIIKLVVWIFGIAHRSPNIHGFWWCEHPPKNHWDSKGPTPPGSHPGGNKALILKDHENPPFPTIVPVP